MDRLPFLSVNTILVLDKIRLLVLICLALIVTFAFTDFRPSRGRGSGENTRSFFASFLATVSPPDSSTRSILFELRLAARAGRLPARFAVKSPDRSVFPACNFMPFIEYESLPSETLPIRLMGPSAGNSVSANFESFDRDATLKLISRSRPLPSIGFATSPCKPIFASLVSISRSTGYFSLALS